MDAGQVMDLKSAATLSNPVGVASPKSGIARAGADRRGALCLSMRRHVMPDPGDGGPVQASSDRQRGASRCAVRPLPHEPPVC